MIAAQPNNFLRVVGHRVIFLKAKPTPIGRVSQPVEPWGCRCRFDYSLVGSSLFHFQLCSAECWYGRAYDDIRGTPARHECSFRRGLELLFHLHSMVNPKFSALRPSRWCCPPMGVGGLAVIGHRPTNHFPSHCRSRSRCYEMVARLFHVTRCGTVALSLVGLSFSRCEPCRLVVVTRHLPDADFVRSLRRKPYHLGSTSPRFVIVPQGTWCHCTLPWTEGADIHYHIVRPK